MAAPDTYAFGDVIGRALFRHTANYEGDYVFKSVFQGLDKIINYPPIPHAVFTNPQIGGVGLTEPQALKKFGELVIGKCNYSSVAMGDALLSEHGFCKLIFSKTDRKLVGAHIIGKEGDLNT